MTDTVITHNDEIDIKTQALDTFIERAYRRYAILTILDRALPDARDGLKPVQRRILYAMHAMNLNNAGPHRKSARVVGEVLGKYHPHGDASVYDAMVRMAQDFSMRSPLIDGQGNFGSIDGDSAAAMRYTEARLASVGEAMLQDIDMDTVDWQENFDSSLVEPIVLPTRFPNLLVNGSSGIAVGMSTSILPHNLGEVCDATIFLAQNWRKRKSISVDELMEHIPGPDFPTGGLIYRYRANGEDDKTDMIRQAYEDGAATIVCQARADIQDIGGGKSAIIVTELPFQVQKTTVLERIANAKEKFSGITDVQDESDYTGMRVVFEVARGTNPEEVLERLLTHTQMRSSLSHNALALIREDESGKPMPQYLNLKDMLEQFVQHRLEVIVRRSKNELAKTEARLLIVQALLKALGMIDVVIEIIRRSQTTETAKTNLIKKLSINDVQAQAILDMPLRRLASLERKKLEEEGKLLKTRVKELNNILSSQQVRLDLIAAETTEIKDQYATQRKTIIVEAEEGHQARVTVADLVIPTEAQVVSITQNGLVRGNAREDRDSVTLNKPGSRAVEYSLQKIKADPEDSIMMVTNQGRFWHGNVGRLPQKADFKDLGLQKDESIVSCEVAQLQDVIIILTKNGHVKRTLVEDCVTATGENWTTIIGLTNKQDAVLAAGVAQDDADVIICTSGSSKTDPRMLRFKAGSVNPQSTSSAKGVAAIKMMDDDLIGASIIDNEGYENASAIIMTEKGDIKRVPLKEFPTQGRGGKGVLCWKSSPTLGRVIGFAVGHDSDLVDIFSQKGRRLRIKTNQITKSTRPSKGDNLVRVHGDGNELFTNDVIAGLTTAFNKRGKRQKSEPEPPVSKPIQKRLL
jgi:DNA gyrase subunit A